ncbi:MAG: hypothetical protein JL56_05105 [Desulfotomaculum sp. BICA1-6]|nr:MAG: hypothetical protein JL56_05105 [Desulfotomaculum sp. BICA1-6]
MEPLFIELTRILTEQGQIIKEQLKASQAQNLALRRLDTESLEAAVTRLDRLTEQMSEQDRLREQVQRKLESALNLRQDATVIEMLPKAPLEIIFKLKGLTRVIRKDMRQLDELNGINNLLTKRALQVNEGLLELLKSGGRKQTYQNSGELKQNDRPNAVLNKTV